MLNNFTYFFKRKYNQIRNVIRWLPVIWNHFEFDYIYAVDVFSHQLGTLEKHMSSETAVTQGANERAAKIRTAIRLMKKVYDEDYSCEYQDKMKDLYGKDAMKYHWIDSDIEEDYYELKHGYELTESKERIVEINEMEKKLLIESGLKQEKAHRILWAFIEHNIRNWWD